MSRQTLKKGLITAFAAFTALAVVLNVRAAGVAVGRGNLLMAASYVFIAVALAGVLVLLWYVRTQQSPYRWRDARWGHEPWREHEDASERDPAARELDWWEEEFDVEPLDDESWQPPWDDDAGSNRN
jgi:hypothetical protein